MFGCNACNDVVQQVDVERQQQVQQEQQEQQEQQAHQHLHLLPLQQVQQQPSRGAAPDNSALRALPANAVC